MHIHALFIISPKEGGRKAVRLEPGRWYKIGRGLDNDIILDEETVSRRHARVRLDGGVLTVEDLGENGTFAVDPMGERERLPKKSPQKVNADCILWVGSFKLVPTESIDEGALIEGHSPAPMLGDRARVSRSTSTHAAPTQFPLALAELPPYTGSPWPWVLDVLIKHGHADCGYLMLLQKDDFLVQAAKGIDRDVCISRSLLTAAVDADEALSILTGSNDPEAPQSTSIATREAGIRITVVPLRAGDTRVAMAYLEGPAKESVDLEALMQLGALFGPLLDQARKLSEERRRGSGLRRPAVTPVERNAQGVGVESVPVIGSDPAFLKCVAMVKKVANTEANVLLRGPTGSGKEVLAQLLHSLHERRCYEPLVAINAAALPSELIESELFGSEPGAFSGAVNRAGAFEDASGGTLFLDEIGDLSLAAQAKILRAIDTKEIVRLGGKSRRVDVRLVTATHMDLDVMVQEGTFRQDLLYRLRVVEVELPSLAERRDDILDLTHHFINERRSGDGTLIQGISARAARALTSYGWPGNVRELRAMIERAGVLDSDGLIDLDDLPKELTHALRSGPVASAENEWFAGLWKAASERFEREFFRRALEQHDRRIQETANAVGVDRKTILNKKNKFDL